MDYKVGSLSSFISGVTVSSNKSVVYRKKGSDTDSSISAKQVKRKKQEFNALNSEQKPIKRVRFSGSEDLPEPNESLPSTIKHKSVTTPDNINSINALRRIQLKHSKTLNSDVKQTSALDRKQKAQALDEEKEARTIFVKNLPHSLGKTKTKQLFRKYGEIESVRLRCAPVLDVRVPKKVAVIKNQFHSERSTICAFICFKTIESATEALQASGAIIEDHHIFVDKAIKAREYDQRKCIFLGNVPFSAEEEEIWEIFEKCGKILDIRIVREAETGIGKGFAYVTFEKIDAIELALNLDGTTLRNRQLRVSRAVRKKKAHTNELHNKAVKHRAVKLSPKAITMKNSMNTNKNIPPQRFKKKSTPKQFSFQGNKSEDTKGKKKKKLSKDEKRKHLIALKLTGKRKSSTN